MPQVAEVILLIANTSFLGFEVDDRRSTATGGNPRLGFCVCGSCGFGFSGQNMTKPQVFGAFQPGLSGLNRFYRDIVCF